MIAPPKTISEQLNDDAREMLQWLAVFSDKMKAAENKLLHATAAEINATAAAQGNLFEAKLTAFAVLGPAINTAFILQQLPPPLDTRTFAEKLIAHGKQLTENGVVDIQPEPQPE